MTLKDRYWFGGFSGTPPSEPNLSTPPPPPPGVLDVPNSENLLRPGYGLVRNMNVLLVYKLQRECFNQALYCLLV